MNYGALYVDMGASGITFRENVISDVPRWVFAHSPLTGQNTFAGNFIDETRMHHHGLESVFVSNHLFQAGVWPAPALDIIGASGIRDVWRRTDLPPIVEIVSPLSKAQITAGQPCVVAARVTYPSNRIERVRFSVNGAETGTVDVCRDGLYRWNWIPDADGPVDLQATADLFDVRSIASGVIDAMGLAATRCTAVVADGVGVAFEAEDWAWQYTRRDMPQAWRRVALPVGYSGAGAIQVLPDNGWSSPADFLEWLPRVDYYLSVSLVGRYYLWLRGRGASSGSDRLYIAVNGRLAAGEVSFPVSSAWSWVSADVHGNRLILDLNREGLHTLSAIIARDGISLDQVYLTRDENDLPTGAVSMATPRIDVSDLPIISISASQARAHELPLLGGSFTIWGQKWSGTNLNVDLGVEGTATWGVDYLPFMTNATLFAAASELTIPVCPIDDQLAETSETVIASILPSHDYVITFPGTAIVDITDPGGSEAGDWRRQFFGDYYAADSADDQDPDGDGLSNLIEEAIGTDPTRADDDKLDHMPRISLEQDGEGRTLHLRYHQNAPGVDVFLYQVEFTIDLAAPDWQPATPDWVGMDGGGGPRSRIIHHIYKLNADKTYYRTRIRRR